MGNLLERMIWNPVNQQTIKLNSHSLLPFCGKRKPPTLISSLSFPNKLDKTHPLMDKNRDGTQLPYNCRIMWILPKTEIFKATECFCCSIWDDIITENLYLQVSFVKNICKFMSREHCFLGMVVKLLFHSPFHCLYLCITQTMGFVFINNISTGCGGMSNKKSNESVLFKYNGVFFSVAPFLIELLSPKYLW